MNLTIHKLLIKIINYKLISLSFFGNFLNKKTVIIRSSNYGNTYVKIICNYFSQGPRALFMNDVTQRYSDSYTVALDTTFHSCINRLIIFEPASYYSHHSTGLLRCHN